MHVVANYRLRYGQLRSYGYRSLISEYYLSSGETLIWRFLRCQWGTPQSGRLSRSGNYAFHHWGCRPCRFLTFRWLRHFKCTVHITFKCTGRIRMKCTPYSISMFCSSCCCRKICFYFSTSARSCSSVGRNSWYLHAEHLIIESIHRFPAKLIFQEFGYRFLYEKVFAIVFCHNFIYWNP